MKIRYSIVGSDGGYSQDLTATHNGTEFITTWLHYHELDGDVLRLHEWIDSDISLFSSNVNELGEFIVAERRVDDGLAGLQQAGEVLSVEGGLTKREQFAMAAMQALQTAHPCSDDGGVGQNAKIAVKCADALLKELEK